MPYKTILVQCDAGRSIAARLEVAVGLAQRYQAHLIGLHARPPFRPPPMTEGGVAMEMFFKDHGTAVQASEAAASTAFANATKGKEISCEWRSEKGDADALLVLNARYADLVILGQSDRGDDGGLPLPDDLPETVAMETGRATLVVPRGGVRKPPGANVLLCWNASRESARAASDALPILTAAAQVTVLIVEPRTTAQGHGAEPGADVATWLSRHGVKVTVLREVAPNADVGDVIASRAMDHGSDLIVMGIYGHSRLREMILGGASRAMLATMPVPVLMAH
jgi:nucleotide-binding universal stress UspA family protein